MKPEDIERAINLRCAKIDISLPKVKMISAEELAKSQHRIERPRKSRGARKAALIEAVNELKTAFESVIENFDMLTEALEMIDDRMISDE